MDRNLSDEEIVDYLSTIVQQALRSGALTFQRRKVFDKDHLVLSANFARVMYRLGSIDLDQVERMREASQPPQRPMLTLVE